MLTRTITLTGDLSFGEPFGSLDTNAYHPWVSNIFGSIKNLTFGVNVNRYPFVAPLLQRLVPAEVKTKWAEHRDLSTRSLRKRLDTETDRPDFVDKMLHARGTKGGVRLSTSTIPPILPRNIYFSYTYIPIGNVL